MYPAPIRTMEELNHDFDDFFSKLEPPSPTPTRSEAILPNTLSTLEAELDSLLQLGLRDDTPTPIRIRLHSPHP